MCATIGRFAAACLYRADHDDITLATGKGGRSGLITENNVNVQQKLSLAVVVAPSGETRMQ